MAVVSGDIVFYGSADMRESDVGAQGGAIDLTTRVIFDSSTLANDPGDGAADGTLSVLSNSAADTSMDVNVSGRNAAGSLIGELIPLSGVTEVNGNTVFERIMKITVPAHQGTITVQDSIDVLLVDIESGVLQLRRPFYDVSADVEGGSARTYYEKIFIKNENSTLALLAAQVSESGDPTGKITFDLESAVDGSNTSTNRQTAPAGGGMQGSFDSADKSLDADTDLGAGEAISVWLLLSLAAGDAAQKNTYTLSISGNSLA